LTICQVYQDGLSQVESRLGRSGLV